MVVKNCGGPVQSEVARPEFMKDFKKLIEVSPRGTKQKCLEMIQTWAHAFQTQASYRVVPDTYNILRMEGYEFPPFNESSDAMFIAEVAPDWKESDKCARCREKFTLTRRRHHCRMCGESFCDACSSKRAAIPKMGVEKPVRVCDACYEELVGDDASAPAAPAGSTSGGAKSDLELLQQKALENQDLTPEEEVARAIAAEREAQRAKPAATVASSTPSGQSESERREQELKEQEEMELALALSMSEAEATKPSGPATSHHQQPRQAQDYREASAPQPVSNMYAALDAEPQEEDPMDKYLKGSAAVATSRPVAQTVETSQPSNAAPAHQHQHQQSAPDDQDDVAIDYSVPAPLADPAVQEELKPIKAALALFELKLSRAATRGSGITESVEIQSLLRSLTMMHPNLLNKAEALGEEKAKHIELKEKYMEIKAARQRYQDRCELHQHKLDQQRKEQELLEKLQLEQKMKLLEQQEREHQAAQAMAQQRFHQAMVAREAENQRQQQLGQARLAQLQRGGHEFHSSPNQLPPNSHHGAQFTDAQRVAAMHQAAMQQAPPVSAPPPQVHRVQSWGAQAPSIGSDYPAPMPHSVPGASVTAPPSGAVAFAGAAHQGHNSPAKGGPAAAPAQMVGQPFSQNPTPGHPGAGYVPHNMVPMMHQQRYQQQPGAPYQPRPQAAPQHPALLQPRPAALAPEAELISFD